MLQKSDEFTTLFAKISSGKSQILPDILLQIEDYQVELGDNQILGYILSADANEFNSR